MTGSLSAPFVRRPVMTMLLTVTIILFGVIAYQRLPVNDLPAVDFPVINVSVGYPGASPTTMANTVATPLEKNFLQIPGLDLVTSTSTQGNASFTLQFELDKSVDDAATDVQAAINRAAGQLPNDLPSPPTFTKFNPNDQPIVYISFTSDSLREGPLYEYAQTQVAQRISILPGVSKVDIFGSKAAIRIKADPSKLAARGLTVDDLATAIRAGTSLQGAGQFDGANRTFLLQPQGQLSDAESYEKLIVGQRDGVPIYLRDVAEAVDSLQDERQSRHFWFRGQPTPPSNVVHAVSRQAGANAVKTAQSVQALIPEFRRELPGSIQIIPVYGRSVTIQNSVAEVKETLIIAFVLVVLVIFAFLGRATDTLIPVVALASRTDVCRQKPTEARPRSVWHTQQPYAPDSSPSFVRMQRRVFNPDNDDLLVSSPAPALARSFAAYVCLVHFHGAGQSLAPGTHHCPPEPMKPLPGRMVAAEAQLALQPKRVRSVFLTGDVPHRLEPQRQRLSRAVEDRSGRHRHLTAATSAQKKPAGHSPTAATTFRTPESVRPSQCLKVLDTRILRREPFLEFSQRARVVFHVPPLHVVVG